MTVRARIVVGALALGGALFGGCAHWRRSPDLPTRNSLVLDQLVIFSDSALPEHHRLIEELRLQRTLVSTKLALPLSDEPIHIYLFSTAENLTAFMQLHYPSQPTRRAFFVESDTKLSVYAYWGDRVAEDLRHETAHGYLHAVVPRLPLWLDEGLAEYFEVPRGQSGMNRAHLEQLNGELAGPWRPNLARLEHLRTTDEMTQVEYAESWAWVHFLLESSPQRLQLIRNYLQRLAKGGEGESLGVQLQRAEPDCHQRLIEHLALVRQALK